MNYFQLHSSAVVNFLSVLTLLGGLIAVVLALLLIIRPKPGILRKLQKMGLPLMLVVALVAMLGSLFFSELVFWVPCKLCWFQRIFMYPQVVLLSLAWWRKDPKMAYYILALSVIGAGFAGVHYLEQIKSALTPRDIPVNCDLSGVSCGATQIRFVFGYITIPMMAFTAFVLNILASLFVIRGVKK